ncbi:MAG: hypothetical protein CMB16_01075 [Euryarchaeota archaeon]|nr:hypothetical protein [Euryarchaeota archaeon]
MVRVSDVSDEEAPTVLIVDNNKMSLHRLTNLFRQREFQVVVCEDGDRAVDEYIRLDPELVVLSLDIPSLDGHLAALEMREHGNDCRILFSAPKRQARLAQEATHSAGAVGWIEKPVTAEALELIWNNVLGPIPNAPGLEDLDSIHPVEEMIEIEEDEELLPAPIPIPVTPLPVNNQVIPQKKKSSKRKRLVIVTLIFSLIIGAAAYLYQSQLLDF